MRSPEDLLDAIDRVPLAHLPTRLQEAPRLARHLGLSKLYVKRDDATALAMGGNKARKLEYDCAAILKNGCDVVVTVGGAQSNHAVMTAAAARRLGIDVKLVLGGADFEKPTGNLLLDALLGAEIRFLLDNDGNDALAAAMDDWVRELRGAGRRPYALPIGGSTGLGALGYVRAMRELADQLPPGPVQVVLAVGSCGTLAGVHLGAQLFTPRARVIGISVSRTAGQVGARTAEIFAESARILQQDCALPANGVECYDEYFAEYGAPTASGREAILLCARLEGLLLDPTYTGKAMAGLIDLTRRGAIERTIPTVFIHTGGLPILFSSRREFDDAISCTKLRSR